MSARVGVVIVAHNSARDLPGCLETLLARAGDVDLEVVIVDSGSSDGGAELVRRRFPSVHVVEVPNRGFAAGNNAGLAHLSGTPSHVLFLNPDTEIVRGSLRELVEMMARRPGVGLAGVRQVDGEGRPIPTMRRFPSARRMMADALGAERWPLRTRRGGERVLEPAQYSRVSTCDWISGSAMLADVAALRAVGGMDERFFLYCEETDLALRIARAGWEVAHLPALTVMHHEKRATGSGPGTEAEAARSRRLYAEKHFAPAHRWVYLAALTGKYLLRAWRPDARAGLRSLVGPAHGRT